MTKYDISTTSKMRSSECVQMTDDDIGN